MSKVVYTAPPPNYVVYESQNEDPYFREALEGFETLPEAQERADEYKRQFPYREFWVESREDEDEPA